MIFLKKLLIIFNISLTIFKKIDIIYITKKNFMFCKGYGVSCGSSFFLCKLKATQSDNGLCSLLII